MIDHLVETDDNPAPPGAVAGSFTAVDGRRLRYALFNETASPRRGTVIVLHGRNECIEKYFETVTDLAGRGLAVATFDWRGQGGSDRLIGDPARGFVDSFYDYVSDLETFFEQIVLPDSPGPYFVLGHSTGSLIALLASPLMVNRVERLVLVAPLLELHSPPVSTGAIRFVSGLLNNIGLGRLYMAGGGRPREIRPFEGNTLTTDRGRYERNAGIFRKAPNLGLGGPTVSWIHAFCRAAAVVTDAEFIADIHVPMLIVAAGADEVVSNQAIERFSHRLRSGKLVTIDGARHEILQEADVYREQFFAAFDAFVPGNRDQSAA
ncbi:MAG: alpha/beta hydrolase [Rhizobiaceae bacterium]